MTRDEVLGRILSATSPREIEASRKIGGEYLDRHGDDYEVGMALEQLEMISSANALLATTQAPAEQPPPNGTQEGGQ